MSLSKTNGKIHGIIEKRNYGGVYMNRVQTLEDMYNDADVKKCLLDNFAKLEKGIIPKSYVNKTLTAYLGNPFTGNYISIRDDYIKNFGFPLFAENWVKPLARWIGDRPCLEIMAGTGYLSYALSKYGCKVKATDNYSWENKLDMSQRFFPVERLDAVSAIQKYGKDVKFILCSWPYMDDAAYQALKTMSEVNDKCRMIYIGEGFGGCTANDRFFDNSEFEDLETFNNAVSKYRRWQGIYDFISLVKFKEEK